MSCYPVWKWTCTTRLPRFYKEFDVQERTESAVEKFAAEVLIWNQNPSMRYKQASLGLLSEIDLGSPTAEK